MPAKRSYKEIYQKSYNKAKKDPKVQKADYAKRMIAPYILAFGALFMIIGLVFQMLFGISAYVLSTAALLAAIIASVVMAQKSANKKFNNKALDVNKKDEDC